MGPVIITAALYTKSANYNRGLTSGNPLIWNAYPMDMSLMSLLWVRDRGTFVGYGSNQLLYTPHITESNGHHIPPPNTQGGVIIYMSWMEGFSCGDFRNVLPYFSFLLLSAEDMAETIPPPWSIFYVYMLI